VLKAKLKPGVGAFTLKIYGIKLIGTLAALLAVLSQEGITAAIGVLGAIIGYLFGKDSKEG
jgi:hypothetical protein